MNVKCLADGVLVTLNGQGEAFDGIIYVKHYSADEQCRRDLTLLKNQMTVEEFKVSFGTCGLTHVNVSISKNTCLGHTCFATKFKYLKDLIFCILNHYKQIITICSLSTGCSQFHISYSKTQETHDIQRPSLQHKVSVPNRRTEYHPRIQRIDDDDCRYDCEHRTSTDL